MSALFMIFRLEVVPEQGVRRYFLQVKKLTFKRAPGSRYVFPTQIQYRGFKRNGGCVLGYNIIVVPNPH